MKITAAGVGRLTRDPETSSTPGGKTVTRLRLAADRRDRDATPVYVDLVIWEKLAEACAEHLAKGRLIGFTGRLDYHEWEKDGTKRSKHEIVGEEIEFLDAPRDSTPDPAGA